MKIASKSWTSLRRLAPYFSVEWNQHVAAVRNVLGGVSHFVLPDLPHISHSTRDLFYEQRQVGRVQTIAFHRGHSQASFLEVLDSSSSVLEPRTDKLLIVGGTDKDPDCKRSVLEGIRLARDHTELLDIWCVADPNDPESVDYASQKIQAGATGIITQPLLTLQGFQNLNTMQQIITNNAQLVVGIAFPTSTRSLLFWSSLLEQPVPDDDELFRQHLDYFQSGRGTSFEWVQNEISRLARYKVGFHLMPLRNTNDLVALLSEAPLQ